MNRVIAVRTKSSVPASVLLLAVAGACGPWSDDHVASKTLGPIARETHSAKAPAQNRKADFLVAHGVTYVSEPLVSSCPGTVGSEWQIQTFGTGCLVITPTGSSYALTDDFTISTPGLQKDGVISKLRLYAQDVSGGGGIAHNTDDIPVAQPRATDPAGFTLHVHADNVPVYRLSGHTGGKRMAMIGTISIGDIVYRAP